MSLYFFFIAIFNALLFPFSSIKISSIFEKIFTAFLIERICLFPILLKQSIIEIKESVEKYDPVMIAVELDRQRLISLMNENSKQRISYRSIWKNHVCIEIYI